MSERPKPGTIGWHDLTVPDAPALRDFYASVIGWTPEPVEMDGYEDFNMATDDGVPVAGVCHADGPNTDLPPCWLMYVHVDDLDRAMAACTEAGGTIVGDERGSPEYGRFCVIRDPAGAHLALFEAADEEAPDS